MRASSNVIQMVYLSPENCLLQTMVNAHKISSSCKYVSLFLNKYQFLLGSSLVRKAVKKMIDHGCEEVK